MGGCARVYVLVMDAAGRRCGTVADTGARGGYCVLAVGVGSGGRR